MIAAWVEHDHGNLSDHSLEALTLARQLAERSNEPLDAILLGASGRPLAEGLGTYGVSTVHRFEHELLDDYTPEAWARSICALLTAASPSIVMAAGSERGNEVMAHVAALANLAMAANCVEVTPGEPFAVTRQRWGGSLLEEACLKGKVKLLTVAPHALAAAPAPDPHPVTVDTVQPELTPKDARVRVVERIESGGGRVSLADAHVVVGGGRGVGSAEAFKELEELAALLGGAIGVSRAVTSVGWRPHAEQVGQTGTRIAPELYIACGISGAIQHMVGCKSAKHLLAINTDPDAPIMAKADYVIVGDVHKVVPAITAEIKKAKAGKG